MSGIAGILNLDNAPIQAAEIRQMVALLERRGPEGTEIWQRDTVSLGHTLLATTPEAAFERLPLSHRSLDCVITADVRLDNRSELLSTLNLKDRTTSIGDAEIVLEAYLRWDESCVDKLLGDFVFAIWDGRKQSFFCGRDHLGMKPFYYHHSPGRIFAFASEPRAILTLEKVPYRINQGRIADFLVNQLEGIDKTSTFFEEVFRLPPAHTLTISTQGMQLHHYWKLEPGPELRLRSNEEYADAFLEVFTEAVRCRLRGSGPVGAMLSGGMDSGSIVAVASHLLLENGHGPLPTFSAIAPDPATCIETRTINAALTIPGLEPHTISYEQLSTLLPDLEELTWNLDEPFDNHMTLPRAVYLLARKAGVKVVLDGVGGDIVLGAVSQLAQLLRKGQWIRAFNEAKGQHQFWGDSYFTWRELYYSSRAAFIPNRVRRFWQRQVGQQRLKQEVMRNVQESLLNPDFADRISLSERLQMLAQHSQSEKRLCYSMECARSIEHPYLTVGRERYDRVASSVGIEPRDPFLDRRLVDFCVTLPGEQKLGDGWLKIILRRAMAGKLPDEVRWRRGKEHLGWEFSKKILAQAPQKIHENLKLYKSRLTHYINVNKINQKYQSIDDILQFENVYTIVQLNEWLYHNQEKHC